MGSTPLQPVRAGRRRRRRWPWAVVATLVVVAAAGAGTGLVRAVLYQGKALPGTRVAGVAVDGRGGAALEQRIERVLKARLDRSVTLAGGRGRVTVRPADYLAVDAVRTAARARDAGRGSLRTRAAALLWPAPPTREVVPLLQAKPGALAALAGRLATLGSPPRDAAVVVVGVTPRAVSGRAGTAVDPAAALRGLEHAALGEGGPVSVVLRPEQPRIGDAQAEAAVTDAKALLAAPVQLRVGGISSGALPPTELAAALRVVAVNGRLVPRLKADVLWPPLRERIARFRRTGVDARLVVEGRLVRVVPSVDGLDVAPGRAAEAVLAAMASPRRTAQLTLVPVDAPFSTAEAENLGIKQQVAAYTTEMGTSSANRIHNVHLMADFIDGTIIRPGEVFSFNRVVGPRTAERGFLVGQALYGTVAVASIGGGVCQTATTLFNNAFNLGLQILYRTNHSTYIDHYPVGRDATVSWGGPDFAFRNDLDNSLLVKASYTDRTLTFTVYGTPQGRRVIAKTGPRTNIVKPQLRYALDLNAPPKSVTLSPGTGESGFDVVVSRTVLERGKLPRKDRFRSHYLDVGPTKIFGPGQVVPRPYMVIPRERV